MRSEVRVHGRGKKLANSKLLTYEIHIPHVDDSVPDVGRAGLVGSGGGSAVDDDVFGGRGEVATQ